MIPFSEFGLIRSLGAGSHDNYAYLVTDEKTKETAVIDPANPEEYPHNTEIPRDLILISYRVFPVLKEQTSSGKIKLSSIINTHQ